MQPPPPVGDEEQRGGVGKWIVAGLLAIVLGVGGFFGSRLLDGGGDGADAGPTTAAVSADASAGPHTAGADAGAVRASDAGSAAPDAALDARINQPGPSDKLTIRSEPKRAKVYLDGSPIGKSPITIDATADSHRLALILPGHKLYTATIDGSGVVDVALQEVTPTAGSAGIKVRCNNKNRYYVFVDGADTGQLCPTERLGVEIGEHVVEVYDPVSETRSEFRVQVKQTRNSLRVRVD
jgi:hypothetical protein